MLSYVQRGSVHDLRRKAPEASSALPDTKNAVALDRPFGVTTDCLLCEDEGARRVAGAREDSARGETRNISVVLGTILLVLGFAGPLALGFAASLFEAIYVGNSQQYRYLSAKLRTNNFLFLLFIPAIASALTGAAPQTRVPGLYTRCF